MGSHEDEYRSDGTASLGTLVERRHQNSLRDAERWTDQDGITWRLVDMAPSHRRNLLAMLRRRAESLAWNECLTMLRWVRDDDIGGPGPDFDSLLDDMLDHASEWLETTPLIKRLRVLVDLDQAVMVSTHVPDDWDQS